MNDFPDEKRSHFRGECSAPLIERTIGDALSEIVGRHADRPALVVQHQGIRLSYGELGRSIGKSGAGRAIGGAVGANPAPILVGCHRVLASNGRITGFSAGEGIPTKQWLLRHERIEYVG